MYAYVLSEKRQEVTEAREISRPLGREEPMTWCQLDSQISPGRRQDCVEGRPSIMSKTEWWAMFSCYIAKTCPSWCRAYALGGLSVGLRAKESPVRFPVRAHDWVVGQDPSGGVREATIH